MSTFFKQLSFNCNTAPQAIRRETATSFLSTNYVFLGMPGERRGLTDGAGKLYLYDNNINPVLNFVSPLSENDGQFGYWVTASLSSVALSAFKNFVFVSEPFRNTPALANNTKGRLFCFGKNDITTLNNTTDVYQTITSPSAASRPGVLFGICHSLSASSNSAYMVVGELGNQLTGASFRQGAAYLYKINSDGKTWNYQSTLPVPSVTYENLVGARTAIYNNLIFVAAQDNNNTSPAGTKNGNVFVFSYNPSTGATAYEDNLLRFCPASADNYLWFGTHFSIAKNVLAVGAPYDYQFTTAYSGRVEIFEINSTAPGSVNITKTCSILPPNTFNGFPILTGGLMFGKKVTAVADSNNNNIINLYINAPNFYNGLVDRGAIFVYRYNISANTATLNNIISLSASELNANPGNRFGYVHSNDLVNHNNSIIEFHAPFLNVPSGFNSNFSYFYTESDSLNTDGPYMFTSAAAVAPGPYINNITQGTVSPGSGPSKALTVSFGDNVSLEAGTVDANPSATFKWIKNSVQYIGAGSSYNLGGVTYSNAGLYTLSAENLVGSGILNHSSGSAYTLELIVTGSPSPGQNRILPSSGRLSIGGELAVEYKSLNQFIKNYSGVGLTSQSSLQQREIDFFNPPANTGSFLFPVAGSKPATGVAAEGSFSSAAYLSVMLNQQEMNRSYSIPVFGGSITAYSWRSNKPDGTSLTPSRMSEFHGAYKWYSPWIVASYRSNAGSWGGPVGPGPNEGTITAYGVNNMVTGTYFIKIFTPLPGGSGTAGGMSGKSFNVWYLQSGGPVTFDSVDNSPNRNYRLFVMDSNGVGYNQNITELQTDITATYP